MAFFSEFVCTNFNQVICKERKPYKHTRMSESLSEFFFFFFETLCNMKKMNTGSVAAEKNN